MSLSSLLESTSLVLTLQSWIMALQHRTTTSSNGAEKGNVKNLDIFGIRGKRTNLLDGNHDISVLTY